MGNYSQEIVEKAAQALAYSDGMSYLTELEGFKDRYRDRACAVLDAVADDLRAEAWVEGYIAGGCRTPFPPNPYRKRKARSNAQ